MSPGEYLRSKRKAKGMKLLYVSAAIGLTEQRISEHELDQGFPHLKKLAKLQELYGFDMNEFMEIVRRVA